MDGQPTHLLVCTQIDGGLLIPYSEGYEWLKRTWGMDLPPLDDGSLDLTVFAYMVDVIDERGYPYDIRLVRDPNADPGTLDFLLVTQNIRGEFRVAGQEEACEVLQDEWKDILKPGKAEEKAHAVLLEGFGRWTKCFVSYN